MSGSNTLEKRIDLSIIIINYNSAKELEACLESLIRIIESSATIGYEIIIVDNNSPDKDLYRIENLYKKDNIHFHYLNENIGFGRGCNYGYLKSSGKYICFLNPDILIEEDVFSPLLGELENDRSIGVIGPKQQTRTTFFDFSAGFSPNIFFEIVNLFGLGVYFEALLISLFTKLKRNKKIEVNWILGAAFFLRADVFKKFEGFDKDYFMFCEEVDLCKRILNYGLKIIYYPKFKVCHLGSTSSKKDYRLYTIRTYSSRYIYLSKHYKSFLKNLMRFLLQVQLISQIIIWSVLYFFNKQKSKQKLEAFFYLLKHSMTYEHRN